MVDRTVTNAQGTAGILTALDASSPGDTVILEEGFITTSGPDLSDYNFTDTDTDADYVTVRSENPDNKASIRGRTLFDNTKYIRWQDIFNWHHHTDNSDPIVLRNNCANIKIVGCHLEEGDSGIEVFTCTDIELSEVTFDRIRSDSIKFGGVTGLLIENCTASPNIFPSEVDNDHVDFIQGQGGSSDITIRGNVLLPVSVTKLDGPDAGDPWPGKTYQGIFLRDAGYSDVLIENNLIHNNSVHGITVGDTGFTSNNVTIRKNTILGHTTSGNTTLIQITGSGSNQTIEANNVSQLGTGGGQSADKSDTQAADYYGNLYQNIIGGLGVTIEGFRPVVGSPVDFGTGMGAEERILELIGAASNLTLTAVTIDSASMGTVAIVTNQLQYTPHAAFGGDVARGGYTMTDGTDSDSARWAVPVTATSTLKANDYTASAITQGSGPVLINVLSNDTE